MKKLWSGQRRGRHTAKHSTTKNSTARGIAVAFLATTTVLGLGTGTAAAAPVTPGLGNLDGLLGGSNPAAVLSSQLELDTLGFAPEVTNALNGGSVALPDSLVREIDANFRRVVAAQQSTVDLARTSLLQLVDTLPLTGAQRTEAHRVINQLFPAASDSRPQPAPAQPPAPQKKPRPTNNPCPPTARACVDLANQTTWLQENGVITWGPVPMASGAETPQTATTKGFHSVLRKVKDDWSIPYNAPMAYSVYFTTDGQAFHEGSVTQRSHGCIHLNRQDAIHYFNTLQVGDGVYVW